MTVRLNTPNDAALFTTVCARYDEDIDYQVGRYTVDAKSLMGILSLCLGKRALVRMNTHSEDVFNDFKDNIKLWIVGDNFE